jgi:hypothetical protein
MSTSSKFIQKELTFVVRQDNMLNGIKISEFVGDTIVLGQLVVEHVSDVAVISEELKKVGITFENIVEVHEEYVEGFKCKNGK